MPELPEVETTRRGISPHIEKRTLKKMIVRQSRLRWPVPKNLPGLIQGYKLLNVQRRSKYLLLDFDIGKVMIHLGMSGSLCIVDEKLAPEKHDHVDFVFTGKKVLRFTDPRRFGSVLWVEKGCEHKLLQNLGPEPLSAGFTGELLFKESRKRKVAIKNHIMDARVVVGVGNIYASEALFRAGVRPTKAAGRISRKQAEVLAFCIKEVLQQAVKKGGTTLRDFLGGDGKPGYFKQELRVYGRSGEACVQCGTIIKQVRIGQRSSFYCPGCQK